MGTVVLRGGPEKSTGTSLRSCENFYKFVALQGLEVGQTTERHKTLVKKQVATVASPLKTHSIMHTRTAVNTEMSTLTQAKIYKL